MHTEECHMQSLELYINILTDKVNGSQRMSIHMNSQKVDIICIIRVLLPKSNHG